MTHAKNLKRSAVIVLGLLCFLAFSEAQQRAEAPET